MICDAPATRAYQTHPRSADRGGRAQPFQGWLSDPGSVSIDPLDRVLGRAFADLTFRAELLASPLTALAAEPMALGLKRQLGGIRAATLAEFARRAYLVAEGGQPTVGEPAPIGAPLAEAGSLAGVGS